MQKQLAEAVEKFKNSQTSLESYQAISDFVKIIEAVPEFIEQVEEEGEKILIAQEELSADKGWDYGLRGRELKEHNEDRDKKGEVLFQLDPLFPLRNLQNVYSANKPEKIIANSTWLFKRFAPDQSLPETDRKEYQGFIDKLYKKILLFLEKEVTEEKVILPKNTEIFEKPTFDSENSVLHLLGQKIKIARQNRKTNAHLILEYIFIDNADDIEQEFSYGFIASDKFGDEDYKSKENAWTIPYTACKDIQEKIRKGTKEKIEDFLILTTGISGSVKINKKYLIQAEISI